MTRTILAAMTAVHVAMRRHPQQPVSTLTIYHNFPAAIVNRMQRIRRNMIGIVRGVLACSKQTFVIHNINSVWPKLSAKRMAVQHDNC